MTDLINTFIDKVQEKGLPYLLGTFIPIAGVLWFCVVMYIDFQMVKCKVGLDKESRWCQLTTTIVEDIEREKEDDSD